MADPVFNEATIISLLGAPASIAAFEPLQTGAALALVNGFDRKIQREPFTFLVSSAMGLHTNLGRLHLITRMRELQKQNILTPAKFDEASVDIVAFCETERLSLLHQMKMMTLCPTSDDKIS
jgi:hypothetical protein